MFRIRALFVVGVVFALSCDSDLQVGAEDSIAEAPAPSTAARRQRASLVVSPGPDLNVIDVSTPVVAVIRNGTAQVSVTLCNAGAQNAPSSRLDVMVSTDATITTADTRVALDTVPAIAAGACITRNITATFSVTSRSYFLGAIADPLDALNEQSESNNILAGPAIYVGTRPDLTISLTSAPPLAAPNANFNVAAVVCNNGTSSASSTKAEVRLSLDTVIDGNDTRVGLFTVGNLAAGACTPVTIPSSGPVTTERYLGVRATTSTTEVDDTNNTALGGRFAIGTGPDLIATLSATLANGVLSSSMQVCNQGTAAAGASTVKLVLSADAVMDAADPLVANVAVGALATGACTPLTSDVTLAVPVGSYQLLGKVDSAGAVTELIESNNTLSGPSFTLGADLALTATTTIPVGTSFNFEATICNQGNLVAGANTFKLIASLDQNISGEDSSLWTQGVGSLAPGQCSTLTGTFAPPPMPAGSYFLIGRTDDTAVVAETDELNNVRVSPPLGLGADLTFEAVNAWMANGQVGYSVRVCNHGNVTTPANPVVVTSRLSVDQIVDGADSVLPTVTVPAMAAGACFDVGAFETPAVGGLRYFLVTVDDANQIVETDEANNVVIGPQLAINPDLALQAFDATFVNQVLSVTAHVCNVGTMPSGVTPVTVRLSADSTFDLSDLSAGMAVSSPPLAPGACADVVGTRRLELWDNMGGVFSVAARIDELEANADLDRSNNTGIASQQVRINPDLALSTLTATFANSVLSVSAHICNLGTMATNAPLTFRLSTDAAYDSSDLLVPVSPPGFGFIDPGACTDVVATRPYSFSDNVSGVFYVVGKIDEAAAVADLDRSNNTAASQQVRISPDLALSALTATFANSVLSVNAHICNLGTMPTNSPLTIRLSTDAADDSSDLLVPVYPGFGFIDPGACTDVVTTRTYSPSDNVGGVFYVVAKLDEAAAVADLDRTNNTAVTAQQIRINPDLALQSLDASFANQVLTVTAHVCNLGTMPSPNALIIVRLSTDAVYDMSDLNAQLPFQTPYMLAPGGCADLVATRTLTSSDNVGGVFFVLGKIDEFAQVPDLDRSNNIAIAPQQARINPDLTIQTLTATLTNQVLTVTARVCNVGTLAPSGSPFVAVRLSADQVYDLNDLITTGASAPYQLAPGACGDAIATRTMAASDNISGLFYVVAKVDEFAQFPDLDLTNNVKATTQQLSFYVDLTVQSVTATMANGILTTTTRVCNVGTMPPNGSVPFSLVLSTDALFDFTDFFAGGAGAPNNLTAGSCADVVWTRSLGVNDNVYGPFYVVAWLDQFVQFPDANRTNNIGATTQPVIISPDLAVQTVTASNTNLSVDVQVQVCNLGNVEGLLSDFAVRLSVDPTYDATDLLLQGWPPSHGLAPGACANMYAERTLSPGEIGGVVYPVARIDGPPQVADLNPSNNVGVGPPLTLL